MINLVLSDIYLADLREDILLNKYKIYDFLGNDIEKAFWFGFVILDVWDSLQGDQPFLYSKPLRHLSEEVESYQTQITFWCNKYTQESDNPFDFYAFILNNLFYDDVLDIIKISIRFGQLIKQKLKENEKSKEIEK